MQSDEATITVRSTTSHSAAELEEAVRLRLNGRVWGFQLVVESEGLVLRGKARSYYAKQIAQQTVMEVTTVRILANEIEVLHGGQP